MNAVADRETILIVDDTPTNIGVISGLLNNAFRTKIATNGERALAIASGGEKLDLILLDVTMPGMDGYEVCRRLKSDPATREIPVIFLTARTDTEDEEKGFALGAVDYIHKPFSGPIVLARVNTQLSLQRALSQVREERTTLRHIMEGMSDGLVAAKLDGTIEYFNQRATDLLRVELDSFVGRPILEAFERSQGEYAGADEGRAEWTRLVSEARERPTAELTLVGPPRLDVLLQTFPLAGEASGTLGILIHDVTADREVIRAKDEMMRLVSHELRAPLTNLLGFTDLMLTRDFSETQRKGFLETMLAEEERLSALINDFLDLERMSIGGQQLNLVETDLSAVVRRAVDAGVPDEERPFLLDVPSTLPTVLADPDRILQVLTNLISNARKYSPAGGQIRIAASTTDTHVSISVTDEGLGLPPEAQARLFEKFYRVDHQEHMEIKGTGLGLAICRQIVEAQGGRIWAQSAGLGQGSTFGFSIPRAREGE